MGTNTSYPVSPPEQRCVWMSAGILTYQLCDRDFDCATCPLDRAMRNMVRRADQGDALQIPSRVDPLRLGRYYTQEHCWISIRTADTIRIGVEPNFAERCRGSIGISLPPTGREVSARVPVVWIRFAKGMLPVRLPLAVHPSSVNKRLLEQPGLLVSDPYDEGWLVEAVIDRTQLDTCRLMTAWMAEKVYGHDEQEFIRAVKDLAGILPKGVGATAYDGGELTRALAESLGGAEYCGLVAQAYCKT